MSPLLSCEDRQMRQAKALSHERFALWSDALKTTVHSVARRKNKTSCYSNGIVSRPSGIVTARIAAEHGSFNRIRHVAPVCTPYNTWFIGPTQVCPPNGISVAFCRFCSVASKQTCGQTDDAT